jgi:16S rRNA (uracil1498-N3)-methyltransferase
MAAPRYFTDDLVTTGAVLQLDAIDAHHASSVLRCKTGEPLTLVASSVAWDAEFTSFDKGGVRVRALHAAADQGGELPVPVIVLQAVTKGAKFDEVVEKSVELGAARIVPVIFARCEATGSAAKDERWRRIARAAAMQSRRRLIPIVDAPLGWGDALERFATGAFTLVAFEKANAGSFANAIATYRGDNAIVIAVGPEGGLQADEVESARLHGARIVSLGPTTLRTETAAAALLAATASSLGWW